MSGTTSSWSQAKVRPVRARPDWISSATISAPASSQIAAHLAQVALGRDDDAALPLHRLEQHGDRGVVDRVAQRVGIAVGDRAEPRCVGAVLVARDLVVGEADDGRGAAVEVALHDHDAGGALGDALDAVAPLAGDLEGGLDGLGAGVHRQDHVLAGEAGQRLGERAELVVVEGAAGQGQPAELLLGAGDAGAGGRARSSAPSSRPGSRGSAGPSTSVTQAPSPWVSTTGSGW